MIYILFILSLFEKWSVKYDLKLDFSYELAITLILFVFIIVRVVTYDLKSIASFFILSTVVISTIVCLIGKSSFYLFLINQIIITGGISLFIYSYINRKKINHLRFIKINIVIILISLILYLISKYYFISTELF
ncbi:hypothetical protein C4513_05895, partial [Morganella morganii]|nr:hypothetical protein [Morganella morganii]